VNQRWRDRRESYRPAGEPIQTAAYEVAAIASDNVAKTFVTAHHYSGTYPAARFRFGLYHRAELVGVAVFSHPCNDAVLTNVFPIPARDAVELGRFVLLDQVPGNGESWFIARCFEQLQGQVAGVVSYSDPEPRTTAAGEVVHPGHVGTIYQATNGVYLGRARSQWLRLLPDGTVFSHRAEQKIRNREKGWRYAASTLEQLGADELGEQDGAAWLAAWLPQLTRKFRHAGNHKYAWALDRAMRRHLPTTLAYPKKHVEEPLLLAPRNSPTHGDTEHRRSGAVRAGDADHPRAGALRL
jgi:hypothetical protein